MAKKKVLENQSELDSIIESEFNELQNISVTEEIEPRYYLDTGNYALNYAITKDLRKGVPGNRISSFFGLSSTGKSMFLGQLLRDNQIDQAIIISSEVGGLTQDTLKWLQVPSERKVRYISMNTFTCYRINKENGNIEEIKDSELPKNKDTEKYLYKTGLIYFIKTFLYQLEYKKITDKVLIIIDSIANVKSVRELSGTQDMGAKGKNLNDMFSAISGLIENTNATLVFSNKVYTNLINPYDPFIQNGGLSVIYNPSVSIELKIVNSDDSNLTDAQLKEEKLKRTSSLGMAQKPIRATIKKSRNGTQDRNAFMLMDSTFGIIPTSGLFTLMCDFELCTKSGSRYCIKGIPELESFYKKDFVKIFLKNKEEYLNKFQKLLNAKETLIAEQRINAKYNDVSEVIDDTENEYSADGIDIQDAISQMEMDNGKTS
jgi:RecA/RadA recombinase